MQWHSQICVHHKKKKEKEGERGKKTSYRVKGVSCKRIHVRRRETAEWGETKVLRVTCTQAHKTCFFSLLFSSPIPLQISFIPVVA